MAVAPDFSLEVVHFIRDFALTNWHILLPVAFLIYIPARHYYQTRGNRHVPITTDFFGNILRQVLKSTSESRLAFFMASLYEKYGETFIITNPFTPAIIATCSPENIKAILSTDFSSFHLGPLRHQALSPLLGEGIFTQDGDPWKHSRQMVRPQFVKRELEGLKSLYGHIRELVDLIPDGEAVDIQPLLFRFTLDTATEFLFGEAAGALSGKDGDKGFAQAFNEAQYWVVWRFRWGKKINSLFTPKAAYDSFRRCHAYVDSYIHRPDDNTNLDDGRYIFLRELRKEEPNPLALRCQALHILLAGRDTTAGLLGWTFKLLAQHSEVWNKLQAAVADLPVEPTFTDLKDCKYLGYIINEVLRLYPSVPNNGKLCMQDTVLPSPAPGVRVKKGQMVRFSVMAMQRRKDIWGEDALEFIPERWEEQGLLKRVGVWGYVPFNGGPRVCLGQQFALMEAAAVVAATAKAFARCVEVPRTKSHLVDPALTMAPNNAWVRFEGRRRPKA